MQLGGLSTVSLKLYLVEQVALRGAGVRGGGAPNGRLGGRVLVSQLGLHSLTLLKAKTVHLATLLKMRPFSMTLFGFISLHIQIYLSVFLS